MNGALAPIPAKRKLTLEKSSPEAQLDQSFARLAEAADPIAMARRDLNKALPRRFYKEATVQQRDGTFILLLDGRRGQVAGGTSFGASFVDGGTGAGGRMVGAGWVHRSGGHAIDPHRQFRD